ncbi:MAG: cytochrome c3 family protein [Thermodesulfobacteriota bacterium]
MIKNVLFLLSLLGVFLFSGIALGRIGGGDISFATKKAKGVVFSHDFHVAELGLTCQRCHPNPYITREKDKRVTMAEMNQGKSCGTCHNGKEAFTSRGNCSKCHKE